MALKSNSKSATAPITGTALRGKVSWFGGPKDPTDSGHTALGLTTATPGIAVYNQGTLGGYWLVKTQNGRTRVIRQTDIGPAPWTGRVLDVTYSALDLFGYTEGNFPTDSIVTAVYLGKDKQAAEIKGGENPVSKVAGQVSGQGGGGVENASLGGDVETGFSIAKDLATGNYQDLGAKMALVGLQLAKDFTVGFFDLIIGPAWHWNQRTVSWYSKQVLDPRQYGQGSEYQWAFVWTAAFWGLGYTLLYTDPEGDNLKPAPIHRTRFARHVRKVQALPARRSLVKPKDVKKSTPKKPPFSPSTAIVNRVGTLKTERSRTVRVTNHGANVTPQEPSRSEAPIRRVRVAQDGTISRIPKPNPSDNARKGAYQGGGVRTKASAKKGRTSGRRH